MDGAVEMMDTSAAIRRRQRAPSRRAEAVTTHPCHPVRLQDVLRPQSVRPGNLVNRVPTLHERRARRRCAELLGGWNAAWPAASSPSRHRAVRWRGRGKSHGTGTLAAIALHRGTSADAATWHGPQQVFKSELGPRAGWKGAGASAASPSFHATAGAHAPLRCDGQRRSTGVGTCVSGISASPAFVPGWNQLLRLLGFITLSWHPWASGSPSPEGKLIPPNLLRPFAAAQLIGAARGWATMRAGPARLCWATLLVLLLAASAAWGLSVELEPGQLTCLTHETQPVSRATDGIHEGFGVQTTAPEG